MTVFEKAYAKINLFLDVTGRREDGFHDILSVMHSVSLADTVSIDAEYSDELTISLNSDSPELPSDKNNLVYRAAEKYLTHFGINANVSIHLEKHIPIGAGLGGGSSDAAATLRALNRIFRKADTEQLIELASELGSDVPFCVVGGIAVCRGRGEKIGRAENATPRVFVVAIGEERISTPKAFAELDKKYNDFKFNSYAPRGDLHKPYNIFESVTNICEITKIKETMIKNGAEYSLMSGSGPSVFGEFKNVCDADDACINLHNNGFSAFVCHSVYLEGDI